MERQRRTEQEPSFLQAKGTSDGFLAFTVKIFCTLKVLAREHSKRDLYKGLVKLQCATMSLLLGKEPPRCWGPPAQPN